MAKIGSSDLDVCPLCLGGNVFGWTADVDASRAVLDGYVAAGGNFVDTSDSYTWRVPGNSGGESETVIGDWLADRGNREGLVIATKVGSLPARRGLSAANIAAAARDSLRRLRTEAIDLYYAHRDDPDVPQEETLRRVRRAGQGRPGARRRGVQLLRRPAAVGAGGLPARGLHRAGRGAAALQSGRARRVRVRAGAAAARRGTVGRALLRAREGLPHRQVPARPHGRQRARRRGAGLPRRAWDRGARPRSTRSPRPAPYRWPRWRWRGWSRNPRSPRRSPAPAPPSSSRSCCRW